MKLMTRPASFPARKSTSSNLLMTSSQVSLPSRPKVKNSASGFEVCSCSSFICAVVERGGVELGDDEAVKVPIYPSLAPEHLKVMKLH